MEVIFRLNAAQESKSLSVAEVEVHQDLIAFLDVAMGDVAPCPAKEVPIDHCTLQRAVTSTSTVVSSALNSIASPKKADGGQLRLGLLCGDSSTSSLLDFQLGFFGLHGVAATCPATAVASGRHHPRWSFVVLLSTFDGMGKIPPGPSWGLLTPLPPSPVVVVRA